MKQYPIIISRSEYWDKVYACWLGKNIGGTLGAPFEGKKFVNDLDFYATLVSEAAPNDDLDFQLVWLKMLEDWGVNVKLEKLAEYWLKHLSAYPWNEYGFCQRNLRKGLLPPVSGCFENYYVDEMGSPIRSEIWACIAPGNPQLAASYAWKDSCLDHSGGEGMYGEMFWAAVESAAFVISDVETLIRIGLNMIPLHSQISRVIREALWCYKNNVRWAEARERIVQWYGHNSACHAVQNHGFTILGLLYGRDFGDKLCKAVNCGYDTDCTGATLGSLLGILLGTKGIPDKWKKGVGEKIVLHKYTRLDDAPKTIAELTDRVMTVAEKVLEENPGVKFGEHTVIPENCVTLLMRNELAMGFLKNDVQSSVRSVSDYEVWLHYNGEPVIYPGVGKTLGVRVLKDNREVDLEVRLRVPPDWRVLELESIFGQKRFLVEASRVEETNKLSVEFENSAVQFIILGPGEARGYPSGQNVPACPTCHGYQGHCLCVKE
ncbi:MAG: ADP-ribosylglycohydrolase family protein [Candidatus Brockarchaeota archaeon]|nr:ADP-ribosylglycohydrolase family protein [Candidatus Brockarchaeota archaeon]